MSLKSNILFILLILTTTTAIAQDNLIFAIDVIRHGDRTPIKNIPKAHQWTTGSGQLTATGMQQEYKLGSKLRKIYVDQYHLLPAHYETKTLYVRSTDADRTLMSAQSFLMGLYPLGTGPYLPDSTDAALPSAAQPIPIHTIKEENDSLLIPKTDKAKFKNLLKQYVFSTAEWKTKNEELKPHYDKWSQATGINITDLYQLKSLSDTLYIDQLYHYPLPVGLSDEDAQTIINAGRWVFVTTFKSPEIGRITGNELLKVIAKNLRKASQQKTSLKYILFSAHDSTLLSQLSALGVPASTTPPYASDLNFSLFDTGNQHYIVKIKYNDQDVLIPGCDNKTCTLEQFLGLGNL
ncbi:MAG: histidine phosphatase family protein [Gammaproteobacteria bacterium]|nr:histidine phosphatase family protein [Gammaproteobacteria bacterium]